MCMTERERGREVQMCGIRRCFLFLFHFPSIIRSLLTVYHLGRLFIEAVCTVVVSAISRALTLAYRYFAKECRLANPVIATV